MIDAIVGSPPYADCLDNILPRAEDGKDGSAVAHFRRTGKWPERRAAGCGDYGTTDGQLGAMRHGTPGDHPMTTTRTVEVQTWQDCYNGSWKGAITPESFCHPAKMSRSLLCRILDFLLSEGWLRKGDTVLDSFSGVATTAIEGASRGLRCIGVELEQRFHDLATGFDCSGEVEGHHETVPAEPIPAVVGGWFVKLRLPLTYWDATGAEHHGVFPDEAPGFATRKEAVALARKVWKAQPEDEREDRKDYQPYFVDPVPASMSEPTTRWVCDTPARCGKKEEHEAHHVVGNLELHRRTWETFGDPLPVLLCGDSRRLVDLLAGAGADGVISSPPYADKGLGDGDGPGGAGNARRRERIKEGCPTENAARGGHEYGHTEGQLGAMPAGDVDAVVGSPPFAGSLGYKPSAGLLAGIGGRMGVSQKSEDGYGTSEGQLGAMPAGDVDAVVGSPPYADTPTNDSQRLSNHKLGDGAMNGPTPYGTTEGQLGAMPAGDAPALADGIVGSPPWEGADQRGCIESKVALHAACVRDGNGHKGKLGPSCGQDYGETNGQLGNEQGDTFWSAARDILRQCHAVLKPGGVCAWVVKAFVRDKALVDFPGQWAALCTSCGLVPFLEVHASLVKEEVAPCLFDGKQTKRKERKSFFRRLAEKQGSPRIDYEVVLFCRKESQP